MKSSTLALAAGIGAISGLRTFTPPAMVGHLKTVPRLPRKWRFLRTSRAAKLAAALAVSELAGDKLPSMPSRLQVGALLARGSSGAACGAALSTRRGARGRTIAAGALLGGVAAIAAAFAGHHLRRRLSRALNVPDPAIAVLEDVVAIGGAWAIASRA